tara:strand:- start:1338 stop:1532 length:195 start_codon:yes stop_codon:yes gene_type:complete
MAVQVHWLPTEQACIALKVIKPECDHPPKELIWKLGSNEYHCRKCETLFGWHDVYSTLEKGGIL